MEATIAATEEVEASVAATEEVKATSTAAATTEELEAAATSATEELEAAVTTTTKEVETTAAASHHNREEGSRACKGRANGTGDTVADAAECGDSSNHRSIVVVR